MYTPKNAIIVSGWQTPTATNCETSEEGEHYCKALRTYIHVDTVLVNIIIYFRFTLHASTLTFGIMSSVPQPYGTSTHSRKAEKAVTQTIMGCVMRVTSLVSLSGVSCHDDRQERGGDSRLEGTNTHENPTI